MTNCQELYKQLLACLEHPDKPQAYMKKLDKVQDDCNLSRLTRRLKQDVNVADPNRWDRVVSNQRTTFDGVITNAATFDDVWFANAALGRNFDEQKQTLVSGLSFVNVVKYYINYGQMTRTDKKINLIELN